MGLGDVSPWVEVARRAVPAVVPSPNARLFVELVASFHPLAIEIVAPSLAISLVAGPVHDCLQRLLIEVINWDVDYRTRAGAGIERARSTTPNRVEAEV